MSSRGKMHRPDPYIRKAGVEPSNCTKLGFTKVPKDQAEKEARSHVDQNQQKNCCTISGEGVTKWELPSSKNKVELMTGDSGLTFFYHRKLDVE